MVSTATVTIDPATVIGEVHDELYGANLAHIGRSVYGGHWAELLRNRKFAGDDPPYTVGKDGNNHNPDFGITTPWEAINPDYQNILFIHDNTTYYTGGQSQRILIRQADGLEHGVQQHGLFLQAEHSYELRVVLKGEGQDVTVRLGNRRWTIPAVSENWQTYANTLPIMSDHPNGTFAISVEAEGNLWIGCASVMEAGQLEGHRRDVVEALREWQPTFLRWPGGNAASAYRWIRGVGNRDRRPSYLDPSWNVWEPNDVGTDEFITFCRLIRTEPVLNINMGNGTVKEAAAWVEYCNGSEESENGAIRAANGHPEPYNVKTWFVGYEQFGNWQVGHVDAETYAHRFLEYARAMREIDPDLALIAVGVPADQYGHWNEQVLKIAASEMNGISLHYDSSQCIPPQNASAETIYWSKVVAAHDITQMLDETLEVLAQHATPSMPLMFDEWATRLYADSNDYLDVLGIGDGLDAAAILNTCIQRCDRVKMAAIFNLVDAMGNYGLTSQTIWKSPTTLVLELMTQHRGGQGIACETDCARLSTPAYDNLPQVDAATTYDPATGKVFLSIINRHPEQEVAVNVQGIQRDAAAEVFLVSGDSFDAANTADDMQAVGIEQTGWASESDTLLVPAHSFAMVILSIP